MRRFSAKMGILSLFLLLGVIYGLEMANEGMRQIHGPMTNGTESGDAATLTADGEWVHDHERELKAIVSMPQQPSEETEEKETEPLHATPQYVLNEEAQPPRIDRLADQAAGLLQLMAHQGIRLVVSVFDSLTR
jgi:hypothetical protein